METFHHPRSVRAACRANRLVGAASRACTGYLCVNIAMMDESHADDFKRFCALNPQPCPIVAVLEAGQTACPEVAVELDICSDLGSYDVIRDGEIVESRSDVKELFSKRTVSFLIGSSVSFDGLLREKGMAPSFGPCIFLTGLECEPVNRFRGQIAVTMRSFPPELTDVVAEYTSHFPLCHGGPLSKNDHHALGIECPHTSLYPAGKHIETPSGHDRLYWACGVTPSIVARNAQLPLMIVHTPGHALITDIPTESLYV